MRALLKFVAVTGTALLVLGIALLGTGIYFLTTRTDLYGIQNYLNDVMNKAAFLQSHTTGAISVRDIPNIGVRMAVAVVAVVPLLVLYPFFQKYFVKGVTLGSVKG